MERIIVIFLFIILSVSLSSAQITIFGNEDGLNSVINLESNITSSPSSSSDFLGLTDTPDSYSGFGGDCVVVNSSENALEFSTSCGSGGGGNPFDQDLNTTSNVSFDDLNLTGQIDFTNGIIDSPSSNKLRFNATTIDMGNGGATSQILRFITTGNVGAITWNGGTNSYWSLGSQTTSTYVGASLLLSYIFTNYNLTTNYLTGDSKLSVNTLNISSSTIETNADITINGEANTTEDFCITGGNCLSSVSGGNPFDQDLNTTSNVSFDYGNFTGILKVHNELKAGNNSQGRGIRLNDNSFIEFNGNYFGGILYGSNRLTQRTQIGNITTEIPNSNSNQTLVATSSLNTFTNKNQFINEVLFNEYIKHYADEDTYLRFRVNNLDLASGGFVYLNAGGVAGTLSLNAPLEINLQPNSTFDGEQIVMNSIPETDTSTGFQYLCIRDSDGRIYKNETGC